MLVKALKSFSGLVSMGAGEVREIENESTLKDLLSAEYVEVVKNESKRSNGGRSKKISED